MRSYGFEEDFTGWDITNAPGAIIENTEEGHAFIGNKILRLNAGEEIISGYVYLPVAGRSYFAIDATDQDHSYSVYWTLKINLRDKKTDLYRILKLS